MGGIAPGAAGGTTTSSTGGGSIGSAGGGFNLGSLFNFMSGSDTGSTSTASAQTKVAASEIGKEVGEVMMDINGNLVQGGPGTSYQAIQTLQTITSPSGGFTKAISGLKKLFDPKSAKAAGDAMKKSFQTGKGIGGSISGVVGVAAEAYGMWKMGNAVGKGVAKALGGGFRTQAVVGGVVGGAAAGYKLGSMFGPMGGAIGAGVGAVVGGILGFLKKKPKIPSSYGSIVVGEDGIAVVGEAGKYGKGSKKIGKQMADAAAKMFNDFAENLDATLTAGSYGSFGQRVFSKKKGATAESFYSLLGTSSKGKPLGREGVDWIKGTDTEVQAFALIQQVRKGMITGLSNVMQQVFANTKATTMEQLQEDIGVGKAYEEFIKGSFHMADLAKQAKDLNDAWKKLSRQAAELGLNTEALAAARDRMMAQMKKDFNYQISQGILGYENPALAAFNDLEREYRETVENAMAVGGDLVAVEKYYGLRRTELVKQMAEEANNGIKKIAKDLLTSLTASSASPLSAQSIFGNAQQMFRGLVSQISSGDYTNVDQLNTYATNYLDAARSIGASSVEYFDIFQEVTDFLKEVSSATGGAGGGTGLTDLPALPDIDTIVAEINARNAEMVAATEQVGEAVVESGTQVVDTLNYGFGGILGALLGQITGTNGYPAGYIPPTGTGVASTGGTGGSYGTSATTGGGGSYGGGSGGGGGIYGSDVNLV
jgi:cell division septum initiation protein DivIVA